MQNQTIPPLPDLPAHPASAPRRVKTREFPTFRTVMALVLREMSSRYGRSPGGYIWAVLEPVGTILILSIAFSFMLRSPPREPASSCSTRRAFCPSRFTAPSRRRR